LFKLQVFKKHFYYVAKTCVETTWSAMLLKLALKQHIINNINILFPRIPNNM
jgi:hypothetical protein